MFYDNDDNFDNKTTEIKRELKLLTTEQGIGAPMKIYFKTFSIYISTDVKFRKI